MAMYTIRLRRETSLLTGSPWAPTHPHDWLFNDPATKPGAGAWVWGEEGKNIFIQMLVSATTPTARRIIRYDEQRPRYGAEGGEAWNA